MTAWCILNIPIVISCSIQVFCLYQQTGISKTSITYSVCLGRQESQYPVEAVDALMMILKETAPNLDCLVEVSCPVHSVEVLNVITVLNVIKS